VKQWRLSARESAGNSSINSVRPESTPPRRRSPRQFLVPLIVGCALFMEMLDSTVITTALPVMAHSLHEDPVRLNLAITSYLLSLGVFIPISGWVADRFGARRVFRLAIGVFTVGSMLCGISHSLMQLVGARILQGLGGAMMTPVGRVVVLKTVPKSDLILAMTYLTVPAMLGPVVGPLVGGFIVTYYSWRWIFFMNLPICIVGIVLVTLFVPDIFEDEVPPLDWFGFVLTGLGLAGVMFFLETVGRGAISAWLVFTGLIVGTSCLIAYYFHTRRTEFPIVELRLFKLQTFTASTLTGGLFRMGVGAMPFLLALLLQVGFGLSPFASGLLTFVSAAGATITKMTIRPIVRVFGFRHLLVVNGIITAFSMAVISLFTASTSHMVITLVLLCGGFFRSLQFTCLGSLAYADVPPNLVSSSSSLASMVQQLSMSLGVTCAALTLHVILGMRSETSLHANDVSPAFVIMAALSLLTSFLFIRLDEHAGHELSGRQAGPALTAADERKSVSAMH
jgi:EmrB/QacA subfamily drug resistance transporter